MKTTNESILNLNQTKNQHQKLLLVDRNSFVCFSLIKDSIECFVQIENNKEERSSSASSEDEKKERKSSPEKVEYDNFFDDKGWFDHQIYLCIRRAVLLAIMSAFVSLQKKNQLIQYSSTFSFFSRFNSFWCSGIRDHS